MGINCVCIAIVISPFLHRILFWGRGFFFTAHFTPSLLRSLALEPPSSKCGSWHPRPTDRRNVGDDFSPRIIQRHKRSLWSEKSGRSIVRPRFNSCPPCSVTFRQLHCQVRVRVRAWVRHPLAVGNLINNRNCLTV